MRHKFSATAVALSILSFAAMFGQSAAQNLSVTNYQFVSEQRVTRTQSDVTYSADLVNSGPALASVTAVLTSLNPSSFVVAPDQGPLTFAPVPANSRLTFRFKIRVDRTVAFDPNFATLQWTFQTTSQAPVANAGPNQSATVGKTVTLNGSGSTNPSGVGTLTYSWAFTSRPPGSTATLTNPTSVTPTFVPDVAGNYVITLTVSNGVASSSASVTVSTTAPPPPVANAGPNQSVTVGSTVVLNGSGSTSGSGNPLTYAWTLTSRPAGSTATLTGANTVSPTFVADKAGTYTAQLIVNDGIASSAPSTVTISTSCVKPVANAGPGQVVPFNSVVQLNGSASTDACGLPLTYKWSLITRPQGSAATLSNSTIVNPTFKADAQGTYVAQLIVNNGTLDSDPATVMISTNPILAPTANAGVNQTVSGGSTVQLNGSGTDPQNLPLTFKWSLITKPAGSAATLSSTVIANPTFIADLAGTYVAQLIVNNGFLDSPPSNVTISTTCSQPTANPGPNQNVLVGATVTLNGSGSGDACHDPLTFAWTFTSRPNGSNATLSGANTVSPTFVADVVGPYVVQLIVNNGFTSSNPATVTVTAGSLPTITLTPNPLNITTAGPGTLTVTLSSAAGANGQVINLASSNTGAATVPLTVTVPQNLTTATVTVTPVAVGSTSITASANNFTSGSATVNVVAPLTITTTSLPNGVVNSAYTATTITTTGGTGAITFSLTGQPTGLNINPTTGVISGTPTVSGPFSLVVTATDSSTPTPQTTSKTFSITIGTQLTITTASLPNGVQGVAYGPVTVAATGGTGAVTFALTGQPAGLSINPTTGVISGTPTASGPFTLVVTATDSGTPAQTATANFNITIAPKLTITTASLPNGVQGVAYGPVTVAATGGTGAVTFALTGQPAGLSINPTTGVISGTPTASGPFTLVVTATDSGTPAQTATANFNLTIAPKLMITTASLPGGMQGAAYGPVTVTATGGTGALTFALSGQPAGLTINPSTGIISGTPTVSGPFNVVVTVTDAGTPAQTATATFPITIAAQPMGIPVTISPVSVGQSLQAPVTLSIGSPQGSDLNFTLTSGDGSKLLINGGTLGLVSSVPVTIFAGQTFVNLNVVGVAVGQTTLTATGAATGQNTATVTPSGFILTGPGGAHTFTVNQGQTANLVVSVAQLDAAGNVLSTQQSLALPLPPAGVTVPLSSSSTTVGTVPSSVTFHSGDSSQLVTFTAKNTGSTTQASTNLSVGVPNTFSAPAGNANQVTAFVSGVSCMLPAATVGRNLETNSGTDGSGLHVTLAGTPTSNLPVIVSTDGSKVLLSANGIDPPSSQITLTVTSGNNRTLDFFAVGVGGGTLGSTTITVNAGSFGTCSNTATLTQSGFVISAGSAALIPSFQTGVNQQSTLAVFSVALDASLNPTLFEPVAPGIGTVSVGITSSDTSVGTIQSPVTFTAGQGLAQPIFQSLSKAGSTILHVVQPTTPPGFSTPAQNTSVTATVFANVLGACGNPTTGFHLQSPCLVSVSQPVQAPLTVQIMSSNTSRLLLSTDPTLAGQQTITVTIPAGQSVSPTFYLQAVSCPVVDASQGMCVGPNSTTATYTATATTGGFAPVTGTVTLAPSGVLLNRGNPSINASVAGGSVPVEVDLFQLDPNNPSDFRLWSQQPLAGGLTLPLSLHSSAPSVGTITSPTVPSNSSTVNATFTPVAPGSTNITLDTPPNFTPTGFQSATATVTQ